MMRAGQAILLRGDLIRDDRGAQEPGERVTDLYAVATVQQPIGSAGATYSVYAA